MTQLLKSKPTLITLRSVGTHLGITSQVVSSYLEELNIPKVKSVHGKWAILIDDFIILKKHHQDTTKSKKQVENVIPINTLSDQIYENVRTKIRVRSKAPYKTVLFVGPTNSGKTYHALEELFHDYSVNPTVKHVYCGPLRLLAYEVYLKMVETFGEENVGFVTGEEQINPDANLLATTTEMAPRSGHSIVVDEAHWLVDVDRGPVWSRLLHSGDYDNFYVVAAEEATELIEKITNDTWFFEVRKFTRKTGIVYGGQISLNKLPPKTAVVCFSRKNVYAVAHAIRRQGMKVGILYGALPLVVRQKQLNDYMAGKYDVMVVTDVIGHGINLPIDNIVFTETQKFDGFSARDLYIWEGAQIAGRAGRFGLSSRGTVYVASGLPWFKADIDLVKQFVSAAAGKQRTDLDTDVAYFAPDFKDLGLKENTAYEAAKMLAATNFWQKKFVTENIEDYIEPALFVQEKENLFEILDALQIPALLSDIETINQTVFLTEKEVVLSELWQLATGPYEMKITVSNIAKWLYTPGRENSSIMLKLFETQISPVLNHNKKNLYSLDDYLIDLERTLQIISEIKMAFTMFGVQQSLGKLKLEDVTQVEKKITDIIMSKIVVATEKTTLGSCEICHKPIKPMFNKKICDDCYSNR